MGIGTFAGALGSMVGMGGGFVMIPLMTNRSLLALTQHQAHGTSLFAVAATGFAGALSYDGQVQWLDAATIAATGMVTAGLGARSASALSAKALKRVLGVLMLVVAPAVHIKPEVLQQQQKEEDQGNITCQRVAPALGIGMCSGYLAGLLGVGGGVLVVPALTLLTPCNHYEALATSLCAMVLPAASGTLTHFRAGNVALRGGIAPSLAVGACLGAYAGGQLAQNYIHDETTMRWGFSTLLVALGLRTLAKAG